MSTQEEIDAARILADAAQSEEKTKALRRAETLAVIAKEPANEAKRLNDLKFLDSMRQHMTEEQRNAAKIKFRFRCKLRYNCPGRPFEIFEAESEHTISPQLAILALASSNGEMIEPITIAELLS